MMLTLSAFGQDNDSLEVDKEQSIQNVTITSRRSGTRKLGGAVNGVMINREELFKAACCNLGESFTTNPSVDVNYSDAATGAKQIKLLGLSGTYVQMLTENLPNFRGAAAPYSLDYVPGPWMKSIQVSKGSSSVRNGYESITGQIDVEYLKPEDEQGATINLYGRSGYHQAGRFFKGSVGRPSSEPVFAGYPAAYRLRYQPEGTHPFRTDTAFLCGTGA